MSAFVVGFFVHGTPVQAQVVINAPPTVIGDFFELEAMHTLNVGPGGTVGLGLTPLAGSVVNISGGVVGFELNAQAGSVIRIAGGSVGGAFSAQEGSRVEISGGEVGPVFDAHNGSEVVISGGILGPYFTAFPGSSITQTGGAVGSRFFVEGVVDISGGTRDDGFNADAGSEVNLYGSEFAIGGVILDSLELGRQFKVTDRDADLTGILADGTAFSFSLSTVPSGGSEDYFDRGATLTLTLVPEPATATFLFTALGLVMPLRELRG